jgi:hypothetical protein
MRLLKQEIEVFSQLGDENNNDKYHLKLGEKRYKNLQKWMKEEQINLKNKKVLDIAGPSVLGLRACKDSTYFITNGDLDDKWSHNAGKKVDVIMMWEVLEHLLNPLKFLVELKSKVNFDICLLTFPTRPSWLWTNIHFHEMRLDRFEYLCKRAGYEIISYKIDKLPTTGFVQSLKKGIRPMIRYFYNPHLNVIIKPI